MKRAALACAIALAIAAWALSDRGMTGHMAAHMIAVAVAAPVLALALTAGPADPARLWPRVVTPMGMMLLELVTVWGWHLPALRRMANASPAFALAELASFLVAGVLLWSAVMHTSHRAAGIGALLLTSMHMTLLGVLVGLAPRPLYPAMHHAMPPFGLDPLTDQQLGGVIMLVIGGASYFLGGLALLAGLLRDTRKPST